jgi:hypothetical protein
LVIIGMLAIVLATYVIVRLTSPSPTLVGDVIAPTAQVVNATPANITEIPPTQAEVPPTVEPFPSETPLPQTGTTIQPAADFITEYFGLINSREYSVTWAKLSEKYKAAYNPDGFGPYTDFWNSVEQVDMLSPDVAYQNSDAAKVSARLNLAYKNGKTGSAVITFVLIPDAQATSWLIDDSY